MEAGGSDVIELGLPFTDPIADGPTIQKSNTVCTLKDLFVDRHATCMRPCIT